MCVYNLFNLNPGYFQIYRCGIPGIWNLGRSKTLLTAQKVLFSILAILAPSRSLWGWKWPEMPCPGQVKIALNFGDPDRSEGKSNQPAEHTGYGVHKQSPGLPKTASLRLPTKLKINAVYLNVPYLLWHSHMGSVSQFWNIFPLKNALI